MARRRSIADLRSDPRVQILVKAWTWMYWVFGGVFVLIFAAGVFEAEDPPLFQRWVIQLYSGLGAVVVGWLFLIRSRDVVAYLTPGSYVEQLLVRTREFPFTTIERTLLPHYGRIEVRLKGGRRLQLIGVPVRGRLRDQVYRALTAAIGKAHGQNLVS